jgi:hypothetical protein
MMAPGAAFVVIGTGIAAEDPAIPLHGLADTDDTNAIAAGAFHHFYCRAHDFSPLWQVECHGGSQYRTSVKRYTSC